MIDKAAEQCSWTGCDRISGAKLLERELCLEHFLEYADRRIATILHSVDNGAEQRNLSPEVQKLLSDVIAQTMRLATETKLLSPLYRDHLIALSSSAADIYRRIQRTPRIARRFACRIRQGTRVLDGSEDCFTVNVSQQGACIEVGQSLKMEQIIFLERTDTARKTAKARVAWIKRLDTGKMAVGLEILGEADFWGLEKRETHANSPMGAAS